MKYCITIIVFFIGLKNLYYSQTVTIGPQIWMSNNLDISTFRNGDPISQAKTNEEWIRAGENKQPAWCYYGNEIKNGETYGKLYNWYAINDPRSLAPLGFHIPSQFEWIKLQEFLGADAGNQLKTGMPGAYNSTGFTGFPGGYRDDNGSFYDEGYAGLWWSRTLSNQGDGILYSVDGDSQWLSRMDFLKSRGVSVRCLKD